MTNTSDVSVGYSEIGKGVDHFLWNTKYLEQSFWAHCFRRTKSGGNGVAKSLGKKKRPSLWPTALEWARNSISVMSRQPRTQPVALDALSRTCSPTPFPASSHQQTLSCILLGVHNWYQQRAPGRAGRYLSYQELLARGRNCQAQALCRKPPREASSEPSSALSPSRAHVHSPSTSQFFAFYHDHTHEPDSNTIY